MPKISIVEQDLTTPGVVNESTDVVYIPGLVNLDQDSLYESVKDGDDVTRGAFIGLGYREPHLFTSVAEFVTLCGERPYKFDNDIKFSDLNAKFKNDAVPVEDILIRDTVSDPAYVMAKELLSAGLCVMYERINYYDHSVPGYDANKDGSYTKVDDATTEQIATGNYYYKHESTNEYRVYGANGVKDTVPVPASDTVVYKLTQHTEVPADFSANYSKYYKLNKSTNELVAYKAATETFDASATYSIDANGSECGAVTNWESVYADYAEKRSSKYYKFDLVLKEVDPDNLYLFDSVTDANSIYGELEQVFSTADDIVSGIIDKGNYSVKYLTSGGYPVYEYNNNSIVTKMLALAEKRGDCVALIDHTDNKSRNLNPFKAGSLYKAVEADADTTFKANGDFGAMFTPWATYNRTTDDGTEEIEGAKVAFSHTSFRAPASFAYLTALADSIKTNANWLAVAGATRGGVLNLAAGGMDTNIPNGVADAMQPRDKIAINAITKIAPYGNTIWGNRTLKKNVDNLVATSFLNIRNLVSDVKKTCYRTARAMTFEQDTDVLWINFKAEISKLLNRMVTGYGISGYKILRDTTHARAAEKATICAKVVLYPTYAVEDFYITIVLKDDEVTVE
jgi:hypothetical protein